MKILYLAHASFLITSESGFKVITDPYGPDLGYRLPNKSADVVLVSHDHHDHNNISSVIGRTTVLNGAGTHRVGEAAFRGILGSHGGSRGQVILFTWEMDGLKLCHLGDLGTTLSPEQVREIGAVDVLFVPVGGHYTLDAAGAHEVAGQLQARVVIPMHFLTGQIDRTRFPIEGVERFTEGRKNVRRVRTSEVDLSSASLPNVGANDYSPLILVLTNSM
ncbi:MAG: MBL fold metallo-hydrolase [bacterium]